MATSRRRVGPVAQRADDAALKLADSLNAEQLATEFGQLRKQHGERIAALESEITELLATKTKLQQAVALQQQALTDLGVIEARAVELEAIEQRLVDARLASERELAQMAHEQDARLAAYNIEELRRNEELDYTVAQRQTRAAAEFAAQQQEKTRLAEMETADRERAWTLRENELRAREQELVDLRIMASEFDSSIAAAVSQAVGATESQLSREHAAALALKQQEFAAAAELARTQLAHKDAHITMLQDNLAAAEENVRLARAEATELTREALRSHAQSGQQALAAVQQRDNANSTAAARR